MLADHFFRPCVRLAVALSALLFWSTSSAHAQPKDQPTPHDAIKDTAGDLFDRGVKAMDEQRWEDCRAAFLAAWGIHRHYQIAGSLAICEAKLARYAEAAEHVSFFLREMPATAPAERKTGGETFFKEIRPKVAELSIRVNKSGAEVFVDGRSVGRAPLSVPVFVEPGDRKLEAKFGDAIARGTVSAKGGGTHEVVLTFGELTKPSQGWRPPLPLVLASGGLALAGLGAGVGLTVAAIGKGDEAKAAAVAGGRSACFTPPSGRKTACDALASAWRDRDSLNNAAVGAFVLGGVLTAATVGLFVWRGSIGEHAAIQVAPSVGKRSGGVILTGQW